MLAPLRSLLVGLLLIPLGCGQGGEAPGEAGAPGDDQSGLVVTDQTAAAGASGTLVVDGPEEVLGLARTIFDAEQLEAWQPATGMRTGEMTTVMFRHQEAPLLLTAVHARVTSAALLETVRATFATGEVPAAGNPLVILGYDEVALLQQEVRASAAGGAFSVLTFAWGRAGEEGRGQAVLLECPRGREGLALLGAEAVGLRYDGAAFLELVQGIDPCPASVAPMARP